MSGAALTGGMALPARRPSRMERQRTWALWASYGVLGIFVVTFLVNFGARWIAGRNERRMSR